MAGVEDLGALVNVEGIEVIQTGIEYPLSSGPATFTVEDLADAVAAVDDPAIKPPRLRLGHEGLNDPEWDGEPAIGQLGNLRLAQEGHLIVGDYVGIPEWLATVLPSAYPGCSIDGQMGVETNTGHNWRLVITDLALLGVRWPGVTTLEDIKALYSKEGPDNVTIYTTEEVVAGSSTVTARTDVDDVRRQYYQQLDSSQFWWWVRSQYYNPDELIVEDEESGELYRVPFTTNNEGEASFGDPVAVRIEYEDKPVKEQPEETKAKITALATLLTRPPEAVFASRDDSRKDVTVAANGTVDPAALRQALGLAPEATDDEVTAAVQAAVGAGVVAPPGQEGTGGGAPGSEQPGTTDSGTPEGGADNQAPGNSGGDPATGQPTTTPVANGAVLVDAARLADLEHRAARGDQALTRFENQDRDAVINAAIKAGKVPKSRQAHWEQQWKADPQGTRHLLTAKAEEGGLAPGLVPVNEEGMAPTDEQLNEDTGYPADWLPDVAARNAQLAAAAQSDQPAPRNVFQGGLINRRGF